MSKIENTVRVLFNREHKPDKVLKRNVWSFLAQITLRHCVQCWVHAVIKIWHSYGFEVSV
jgi:hypothetical protein